MKQILLAAMLLFVTGVVTAQSNGGESFLEEGKTWLMRYKLAVNPKEYGTVYRFNETSLRGDTTINGVPFKGIYQRTYNPEDNLQHGEWHSTSSWLGQDGSKIYLYECLWGDTFDLRLIMDFEKSAGDVVALGELISDETPGVEFVVISVSDTILENSADRCPRKCLYLQNRIDPTETDVWIEGIGSLNFGITGIVGSTHSGSIPLLMKCTKGDVILYQIQDDNTSIRDNVSKEDNSTGNCYDLQGRWVNSPLRPGIYIQNGKAFVVK